MKTAEEFLLEKQKELGYNPLIDIKRASICLQEFAKLHVKAALEARDELYETYYEEEINWTEDNKRFIRDSYPLSNIK